MIFVQSRAVFQLECGHVQKQSAVTVPEVDNSVSAELGSLRSVKKLAKHSSFTAMDIGSVRVCHLTSEREATQGLMHARPLKSSMLNVVGRKGA